VFVKTTFLRFVNEVGLRDKHTVCVCVCLCLLLRHLSNHWLIRMKFYRESCAIIGHTNVVPFISILSVMTNMVDALTFEVGAALAPSDQGSSDYVEYV